MSNSKSATILLVLLPVFALAQAVQPCVVKQYNQKEAKTPLAGVQVEVRGAGTEVSDAQGALTLNFTTLKPGDRVTTRSVSKSGYEVFNTSAVEQWTICKDRTPFQIVLVKSEYMVQLKQSLRETSTENYKAKYEQAKRELEAEKKAGKLKDEEYRQQVDALEDQYDNALKDLDNYIDQFAHFDLNEVSAEEQRILEMVQQGQINEAVEAYEALNIGKKLIEQKQKYKQLKLDSAKISEAQSETKDNIDYLEESFDREITTLKLAGGADNYAKIGRKLKEQAMADTTDYEAVYKYATFAQEQNMYQEAEQFYKICLNMDLRNDVMYGLYIHMGDFYEHLNNHAKAEEYYRVILEYLVSLSNQNPIDDALHAELANILNRMGILYSSLDEYSKTEEYYLFALDHFLVLFAQDSVAWRPEVAMMLNNLGGLNESREYYSKAENYYLAALKHRKILFAQDSDAWRSDMASIYNNLGYFYMSIENYSKAEPYFIASYNLFAYDSDLWRSELARAQSRLGYFYIVDKDYVKSEEYYDAALKSYQILFGENPGKWRVSLAKAQRDLGDLFQLTDEYQKSEEHYLAALGHYNILHEQDSTGWYFYLERVHEALGTLYSKMGYDSLSKEHYNISGKYFGIRMDKTFGFWQSESSATHSSDYGFLRYNSGSTEGFLSSLEHCKKLFAQNPTFWRSDMAILLKNMGKQYQFHEEFSKAEEYYLAALEHYMALFEQYPEVWRLDLAALQKDLGDLYSGHIELGYIYIGKPNNWDLEDYPKAEKYYHASLEHYKVLFEQYPNRQRCDDLFEGLFKIGYFCQHNLKDFSKAEEYYLTALDLYQKKQFKLDHLLLESIHSDLAYIYEKNKDYSKAEKLYLIILEDSKAIYEQDSTDNHLWDLGYSTVELGSFYESYKDYSKAEEYYLAALKLFSLGLESQTDDTYAWRLRVADLQHDLGYLYRVTNNYVKSEEFFLAALELRKVMVIVEQDTILYRRAELAETQNQLGYLYWIQNDYSKAEELYLAALDNYLILLTKDSSRYCEQVADIELDLANLYYFQLKEYEKCEIYYISAVEHCERLYARDSATYSEWLSSMYNGLAYAYAYNKKYPQALSTIEKAVALMPNEPNYYDSKGEILLMTSDEQGALEMWRKVLELDPDFLKHLEENGNVSVLYNQLKKNGLVK